MAPPSFLSRLPHPHLTHALRDGALVKALVAEFLGVMFFQLLAGSVTHGPVETAAAFAAIMYFTSHISGGHLNPVVSLAAAGTGHIDLVRGVLYAVVQILGAIVGAILQVWLVYGNAFGKTSDSCFSPPRHVTGPQLWGWEFLLTFLFLAVMYSALFIAPGHGSAAPLAAGLALLAALSTGGFYTGGSPLNPARVLANMLVFRCGTAWGWSYLAAHLAAVGAAVAWVWPVHGLGMYMGGENPAAFTGTGRELGGTGLTDPLMGGMGSGVTGGRGIAADPAGAGTGYV
ncbi:hypothetical protein HYH03_015022 [Edaphochlamys debaryana]|uniref:Aquaporin n=1 Tax=Edaphochlamys debaryana TaxID=47281 RepID=A0A835XLL7_9CHLO|nr:hypothetical protein HYH03_015022 [Edaphochlamys debaryana]|eukprot:KAG2486318.1 hypothetical protein HYH03_015022 [Edaphochlamys debaryana]